LENALSKFKHLSVALVAQPEMDIARPEEKKSEENANAKHELKPNSRKSMDKGKKSTKSFVKANAPKSGRGHATAQGEKRGKLAAVSKAETKENRTIEKKTKKDVKKEHRESLTEELKQKVFEMYGDDAQFDDIQSELVTAYCIIDDKENIG